MILQYTVYKLVISFQPDYIVFHLLGILCGLRLWLYVNDRISYLNGFYLSGFHHLHELIIGEFLTLAGLYGRVHPAHNKEGQQSGHHQHGDGLPVAVHILVLLVVIIHTLLFLPLNEPP